MAGREWLAWDETTAHQRPDVVEAVERFASLDVPLGDEAARWLREDALANDGSTRTRLLVAPQRVEGYVALCAGQVMLEARDVASLELPAGRSTQPAILLAWIARHRDSNVSGTDLMDVAFAIARRVSRDVGAVAFCVDPGDEAVARVWRAAPYGFRPAKKGSRLWVPLNPWS